VFFTYNDDRSASYVGIYMGDGQFIAENNEDSPVCLHDMTLDYYMNIYVGARRYF
jgi:cell wall-associated NlpC family hydrolase